MSFLSHFVVNFAKAYINHGGIIFILKSRRMKIGQGKVKIKGKIRITDGNVGGS
jgi:hypothetical protein